MNVSAAVPVPDPDQIAARLAEMAGANLGRRAEDVDIDMPLMEQGIDSLGLAEFIFEVEDAFGVGLSEASEASAPRTIRQLAEYIAANRRLA